MQSQSLFTTSGVILAGGEGTRLGLGPKAMVSLAGKPLIAHVIERLQPQTQSLAVNLRAAAEWTHELGLAVITDTVAHAGPLAGVAAALDWAQTQNAQAVLTCPADSPFIPPDLCARLSAALNEQVDIVVATSNGQRHHLAALWRVSLIDRFASHLKHGASAVHRFQDQCRVGTVDWAAKPVDPFFNINTADDLTMAARSCSSAETNRSTAL
jgi:molybdopterin-guanine dinucleotide biosynthesis protein A